MDILRLTIVSIVTTTLLMGCDNKSNQAHTSQQADSRVVMLSPKPRVGDNKEYWIQSYSTVSNDKIDWSNQNQRLGTKALVSYQVQDASPDHISLHVTAQHIELLIRDNAAFLNPTLQKVMTHGLNYQLNFTGKDPLTINNNDAKTKQNIADSIDLRTEYNYLTSVLASPFFPTSLPLVKGQKATLAHFMQMDNMTIRVDEVTDNDVSITIEANNQKSHLYGKAVLHKETGWLERMALVKEAPLTDRTDYTIRTVLLLGPSNWSASNNRQLQEEMQIKEKSPYLKAFPVFDFDTAQWLKTQQEELNNIATNGKLYTLTNPDGSTQLILVTSNTTEAIPQLLGDYKVLTLALFDKDNKPIANNILLPTHNAVYKIKTATDTETNLASYKLKKNNETSPIKLQSITKATANIGFTPYHIETVSLPLTNKPQKAALSNEDFTVDITPTDQPKVYILHWRGKDNIIFNPQLMKGADNALVQFIQPDTEAWLTPAETRIVNSIPYGFENRVNITFTTTPPKQLDLYFIKQDSKATHTTQTINFNRD